MAWEKPEGPPELARDEEERAAKPRPIDPRLQPMVTIALAGGGMGPTVLRSTIEGVLERAARYRRRLAQGMEPPDLLDSLITGHLLSNEAITLQESGWCKVGFILDPWGGPEALKVWWHLDTDRVQVSRPSMPPSTATPVPPEQLQPLRIAGQFDTFRNQNPVIAQPGWIYTYRGIDYDAEGAMEKVRKIGSIDGWTWRTSKDIDLG